MIFKSWDSPTDHSLEGVQRCVCLVLWSNGRVVSSIGNANLAIRPGAVPMKQLPQKFSNEIKTLKWRKR